MSILDQPGLREVEIRGSAWPPLDRKFAAKIMDQIEAEDPGVQVALLGFTVILERIEGALTKLVYLSTLRDNQAGTYFHPSLAQVHGADRADRALAICHRDLFMWLVKAPVSQYVKELDLYLESTTGAAPAWRALEPYRSAIPSDVPQFLSEIYFHNVESALLVLEGRSSTGGQLAQGA